MVSWLLLVASWRMPPGPFSPKKKIGVVCCPGNNKAEGKNRKLASVRSKSEFLIDLTCFAHFQTATQKPLSFFLH